MMNVKEIEEMNKSDFMTVAGFRISSDSELKSMIRNGSKYVTPPKQELPEEVKNFLEEISDTSSGGGFLILMDKCYGKPLGFFDNKYLDSILQNFVKSNHSISILNINNSSELNFIVTDKTGKSEKFLIDMYKKSEKETIDAIKASIVLIVNCTEFGIDINSEIIDSKFDELDIIRYLRGEFDLKFQDQDVKTYASNTRENRNILVKKGREKLIEEYKNKNNGNTPVDSDVDKFMNMMMEDNDKQLSESILTIAQQL